MIDANELRERATYSIVDGIFRRRYRWGRLPVGSAMGCLRTDGYLEIKIRGQSYACHRLAWLHVTGEWPEHDIDHRDGIKTHNWWLNLRSADDTLNAENRRRPRCGRIHDLPLGVTLHRTGKYQAQIEVNSKSIYLGLHRSPQEAHAVYVNAKRRLHAGCTI